MADGSTQIEKSKPVLIAIGGLSGSGKSTLAQAFSKAAGVVLIDSGSILKEMFGATPTAMLLPHAYSAKVRKRVQRHMDDRCRKHLRAGRSVVMSQTFIRAENRARTEAIANDLGVAFHGIWLDTDLATQFKRVSPPTEGVSDATTKVILKQAKILAESGPVHWKRVDAGQPADGVFREAAAPIAERIPAKARASLLL